MPCARLSPSPPFILPPSFLPLTHQSPNASLPPHSSPLPLSPPSSPHNPSPPQPVLIIFLPFPPSSHASPPASQFFPLLPSSSSHPNTSYSPSLIPPSLSFIPPSTVTPHSHPLPTTSPPTFPSTVNPRLPSHLTHTHKHVRTCARAHPRAGAYMSTCTAPSLLPSSLSPINLSTLLSPLILLPDPYPSSCIYVHLHSTRPPAGSHVGPPACPRNH